MKTAATFQGHYFNEQDAEISTELRSKSRSLGLDLDGFLALSSEERAARWRQWDRAAKFDACAQMLARRFGDWDAEAVEHHIAKYDERWGTEPESDLAIPAAGEIADLAKERYDQARRYGDLGSARQLDRVRANVLAGAKLSWHLGDLLISSLNTIGAVYSVNGCGCTCPNGAAGKAQCWHVALYDLLLDMQEEAAVTADTEAVQQAAAHLLQRLAAARRVYLEAA